MEMHPLGTSGLRVSRLGLGLAALGRPGYINLGHASDLEHSYDVDGMEARAHAVLDAAWNSGIRYFDVARSYGRAEHFLASWLHARGLQPDRLVVGSKWGYTYTADWRTDATHHEIKEHSLPILQKQTRESQSILGSYLKVYQIHSATLESGVLQNTDVLDELTRLRDQGWKIGLSVSGPQQTRTIERALLIESAGERLFSTVQATWNLLELAAGPTLALAHDAGLGIIIKEALANGRLTSRNHDPAFLEQRHILEQQAERLGTTLDGLALAAVLAQPWVDVVLSGAATVSQLESNASAVCVSWDDTVAQACARLAEPAEDYWSLRSRLVWN